jgi:hypothetical protein
MAPEANECSRSDHPRLNNPFPARTKEYHICLKCSLTFFSLVSDIPTHFWEKKSSLTITNSFEDLSNRHDSLFYKSCLIQSPSINISVKVFPLRMVPRNSFTDDVIETPLTERLPRWKCAFPLLCANLKMYRGKKALLPIRRGKNSRTRREKGLIEWLKDWFVDWLSDWLDSVCRFPAQISFFSRRCSQRSLCSHTFKGVHPPGKGGGNSVTLRIYETISFGGVLKEEFFLQYPKTIDRFVIRKQLCCNITMESSMNSRMSCQHLRTCDEA